MFGRESLMFFVAAPDHFTEERVGVVQKVCRGIKLVDTAEVQHQNPFVTHDCIGFVQKTRINGNFRVKNHEMFGRESLMFFVAASDHLAEERVWVVQKVRRGIELADTAALQHQNPVVTHDRIQPEKS